MEKAFGNEQANVGAFAPAEEKAKWRAHWSIKKFLGDYPGMTANEIEAAGIVPYEVLEIDGNCLLNDGINAIIWPAVVGSLATPLNGTDGCMGVGDSASAAALSGLTTISWETCGLHARDLTLQRLKRRLKDTVLAQSQTWRM